MNMQALVSDVDYARIAANKWKAWQCRDSGRWYAVRYSKDAQGNNQTILMHREVLGLNVGDLGIGDHIRRNDTLDNCRENLRVATHSESMANRGKHKTNKSGYKGVYLDKCTGRWRAELQVEGRTYRLGRHDTPEEAHAAYCEAVARLRPIFGSGY